MVDSRFRHDGSMAKVIVAGGGAAGLVAAWRAASLGHAVTLLEGNGRLGVKLRISGGGKCNITHDGSPKALMAAFPADQARFLARQGLPWDLMAWSFSRNPGKGGTTEKTAVQLQREAAVVLALGGGFQAYFRQKRDGSVFDERVPVMAEVAKFCRARQAFCHHATQVPQIAVGHDLRLKSIYAELGLQDNFVDARAPDRDAKLRAALDRVLADPEPVRAALRQGYEQHLNKARCNRELLREFARARDRVTV